MNRAMMTATIALAVGLAGCGKKDAPPADDTATAEPAATMVAAPAVDPAKPNDCAKLTDVALTATIDKATNLLKIDGTANAPTPGYATALQAGPLDKMNPPNQVVLLRANAPGGATAQVVTPVTLSLHIPSAQPSYNSIRIACPGVPDVELKVS